MIQLTTSERVKEDKKGNIYNYTIYPGPDLHVIPAAVSTKTGSDSRERRKSSLCLIDYINQTERLFTASYFAPLQVITLNLENSTIFSTAVSR